MRTNRSRRGQSYRGRTSWPVLWNCRGIWPGCSADSPPTTTRTPPGSETGTEWAGVQDHIAKLFNITASELLHIWQTDASAAQNHTQRSSSDNLNKGGSTRKTLC